MKQLVTFLFLAGFILFSSCSEDEGNSRVEYSKEDVIGRWVVEKEYNLSTNQWDDYTELGDDYMWAEFDRDSTYTGEKDGKQHTGTWTLSKDKIICQADSLQINYRIKEKVGEKATFVMTLNNLPIGVEIKAVRK